jgi:hypothetical protein
MNIGMSFWKSHTTALQQWINRTHRLPASVPKIVKARAKFLSQVAIEVVPAHVTR